MNEAPLPIDAILSQLTRALLSRNEVVLKAPPGAGKTTRVPLALLTEPWLKQQKILMLEPRRLAARAAAQHMSAMLNEKVGTTVGYRVRLEARTSQHTRIEVITEGILTRLLQEDPTLSGVGLIIFDEFHERNLEGDLGLSLSLQSREIFRDAPLKILIMSATLEDQKIAELLIDEDNNPAPIIESEGRSYPVQIQYRNSQRAPLNHVVPTIMQALTDHVGNILVFLPGQSEIQSVFTALNDRLEKETGIIVAPLYGSLPLARQQTAVAPPPEGQRKVVLATSIAESSLTIEGITVVIDTGLSRQPSFDTKTGMTRLNTRHLSRAASEQRAGRAGRIEPGYCYRLWSETQQSQLSPQTSPDILQADLAPLALQLLCWGVNSPAELDWLDPPPDSAYQQALNLLQKLGAVEAQEKKDTEPNEHYENYIWKVTPHGRAMESFPAHPRIAHMLLTSRKFRLEKKALVIATLLSERDPLTTDDSDFTLRVTYLEQQLSRKHTSAQRLLQQYTAFEKILADYSFDTETSTQVVSADNAIGFLIACAYPERIACERQPGLFSNYKDYRMSTGRAASLKGGDHLQRNPWLVIAHAGGHEGSRQDKIFLAAALDPKLFQGPLRHLLSVKIHIDWDNSQNRLITEKHETIDRLVLSRSAIDSVSPEQKCHVLLRLIREQGLTIVNWPKPLLQWRARVQLLFAQARHQGNNPWPDLSDDALLKNLECWLGPYLDQVTTLSDLKQLDLTKILHALLPWPLAKTLDTLAPSHIEVPSGSRIAIDYLQNPPVLAVKLQEMFGCTETPAIVNGSVTLVLHLLSPAQRPLQITQDLKGFWKTSYAEVKKEMKGRYPKHPWPDDPLSAQATVRTKNWKPIR